MIREPQGPQAARLRQRQFQLARRFQLPADRLPGSLSQSYTRCGKASCHCADGRGHAAWTLTFMGAGKRRTERMPREGVEEVGKRGAAGRQLQEAVREVRVDPPGPPIPAVSAPQAPPQLWIPKRLRSAQEA